MYADWQNHTKIRAPRSEDPKCPAAGVLCASRIHESTFDYDSQRPGRSWTAVKPGIMGDIPGPLVPHLSINNALLLGSHFSGVSGPYNKKCTLINFVNILYTRLFTNSESLSMKLFTVLNFVTFQLFSP